MPFVTVDAYDVQVVAFLYELVKNAQLVKPEYKYGNSRFDIYVETESEKIFVEVKGVTLEDDGVVRFPDAPTERGVKHLKELQKALTEGYKAYVLFIIQMSDVKYFEPNRNTHPQFADVLKEVRDCGVIPLAYDCSVSPDEIKIRKPVLIKI